MTDLNDPVARLIFDEEHPGHDWDKQDPAVCGIYIKRARTARKIHTRLMAEMFGVSLP